MAAGYKVCVIDPSPLAAWPNNYGALALHHMQVPYRVVSHFIVKYMSSNAQKLTAQKAEVHCSACDPTAGVWVDEFRAMGLDDCLDHIWNRAEVFLDSGPTGQK